MNNPAVSRDSEVRVGRQYIDVTRSYVAVVDDLIAVLAGLEVYQRAGLLVEIVRDENVSTDGISRHGSPRVRRIPSPRLRELLDSGAVCFRPTSDGGVKPVRCPSELVAMVAARGQWSGVRPLVGCVTYPVLRPDGTVLARDGYDSHTGLLVALPRGLRVPTCPTSVDAARALAELTELVSEFPFASEVALAAWLAALLTPLARPAIDGPVPMLLLDANMPGAGKSLLADLIGAVVLGQRLPRRSAPESEAEWRKAMLAIAVAADPVVLIDNVTHTLRSAALDAVLTGTAYRDRILGRSEELSLDVRTTFIATSNNATVSPDLVRRSLHCRLVSQFDNPAGRSGFTRVLPDEAILERDRYLSAALTVLLAYAAAGRPRVATRPLGSFEAWGRVVRDALVWAGQPDPAGSQDELRDVADPTRSAFSAVLAAWHEFYGDAPVTSDEILADGGAAVDSQHGAATLLTAISEWLDGPVTARRLGSSLRSSRDKVVGDMRLTHCGEDRRGNKRWRVVRTETPGVRVVAECGNTPPDAPPADPRPEAQSATVSKPGGGA